MLNPLLKSLLKQEARNEALNRIQKQAVYQAPSSILKLISHLHKQATEPYTQQASYLHEAYIAVNATMRTLDPSTAAAHIRCRSSTK